jgi:hypothetical protein
MFRKVIQKMTQIQERYLPAGRHNSDPNGGRRHKVIAGVAGAAVLAAGVGAGVALGTHHSSSPSELHPSTSSSSAPSHPSGAPGTNGNNTGASSGSKSGETGSSAGSITPAKALTELLPTLQTFYPESTVSASNLPDASSTQVAVTITGNPNANPSVGGEFDLAHLNGNVGDLGTPDATFTLPNGHKGVIIYGGDLGTGTTLGIQEKNGIVEIIDNTTANPTNEQYVQLAGEVEQAGEGLPATNY